MFALASYAEASPGHPVHHRRVTVRKEAAGGSFQFGDPRDIFVTSEWQTPQLQDLDDAIVRAGHGGRS
ncbi:hypothetical protein [Xylophilus sp. GOD-11R]|uniref:hypothetical protein n=1 Tax=Xylophilus sp. GOD-11R TaxID=3089814 RepID=UPI00298C39C8|nr:hypothetical protein [Xylophilus sp. GOD-11R]WPB58336.1 hypothetical protein R9X41_06750 [Xylophilus sp. GOD-11R]